MDRATTREARLSRRKVLRLALTAPIGASLVAGCGGLFTNGPRDSGDGGGSTGPIPRVAVRLQLDLPGGLDPRRLALTSGFSAVSPVTGSPIIVIPEESPAFVSVIEASSGKLVMFGLLDPASANPRLDSASFALGLLFLAVGGSQRPDRHDVVTFLRSQPALTTLAGVLAARLEADPFALTGGDSALDSAVAQAVGIVGPALPDYVPDTDRSYPAEPRTRQTQDPPEPHIEIALVDGPSLGPSFGQMITSNTQLSEIVRLPDYFDVSNRSLLTSGLTFFPQGQSTLLPALTEPLFVPGATMLERGWVPQITLSAPDEDFLPLVAVSTTPFFDAGASSVLSDPEFAPYAAGLEATLAQLRQLGALRIACDFVLDALGLSVPRYGLAALREVHAGFRNRDEQVAAALASANAGVDLPEVVDAITAAMTEDELSALITIDLLRLLAQDAGKVGPMQLMSARALATYAFQSDLSTFAATYGALFRAHKPDPFEQAIVAHRDIARPNLIKVKVMPTPENSTYETGGSPVAIEARTNPDDYAERYSGVILYKWKLFGAGDGTLDDGDGRVGREFETREGTVSFRPAQNSTGVQSVGVEMFIAYDDVKRSMVQGSASLNESGGASDYRLQPALARVEPGGFHTLTVWQGSFSQIENWEGVNLENLRLIWELSSEDVGLLSDGSQTGLVLETTTNVVRIDCPEDTPAFDSADLTVTVRLTDPGTGDFTNLAVLTGKVQCDVRNDAQVEILESSFSIGDLSNSGALTNYDRERGVPLLQGNQYVLGGEFSRGRDTLLLNLFLPQDVAEGDRIFIGGPNGGNNSADLILWSRVAPSVYNFVCTGNGFISQIERNPSNQVTYVQVSVVLEGADSFNGGTVACSVAAGYGAAPNSV